MKRSTPLFSIAGLAVVGLLGARTLQEPKKAQEASKKPEMAMPAPPTAGPFHAHLKMDEGVWDAVVRMQMDPKAPPMESKAVETNKIACNGLWLLSDVKGEFMGGPFEGHAITGYDPAKKKYVSVWVDSMGAYIATSEGECDASGKVLTMTGEMPDPMMTGKMVKHRDVLERKDADNRLFTSYMKGPDGKEVVSMTIIYKRKK